MDVAWKVTSVFLVTVACHYALARVFDRFRRRRNARQRAQVAVNLDPSSSWTRHH